MQNVVPRGPAAKGGVEAGDLVVAAQREAGRVGRRSSPAPSRSCRPARRSNARRAAQGRREEAARASRSRSAPRTRGVARRGEDEEDGEGERGRTRARSSACRSRRSRREIARQLGVPADEGVVVAEVVDGGPAQRAGLRRGDVILEVNRQPVKKLEDVSAVVGEDEGGRDGPPARAARRLRRLRRGAGRRAPVASERGRPLQDPRRDLASRSARRGRGWRGSARRRPRASPGSPLRVSFQVFSGPEDDLELDGAGAERPLELHLHRAGRELAADGDERRRAGARRRPGARARRA